MQTASSKSRAKTLKTHVAHQNLSSQAPSRDFKSRLQEELVRRCKKNPNYSLRAFAQALDIDFSTLSKFLRGKRRFRKETVLKLSKKLGLDPVQAQAYALSADGIQPGHATNSQTQFQQLSLDSFQIISDWEHYAILELLQVQGFKPSIGWVAQSLGLSTHEVQAAVDRLVRVGMLEISEDGTWMDGTDGTSTTVGNDFSASAFRNLQKQVLEKALEALEQIPMEVRDQTSLTMAIDSSRIPEAKERIKKFRRELGMFLTEGTHKDHVYQMSVSLYPVTRNLSVKERKL